jgi:hypothetical protein
MSSDFGEKRQSLSELCGNAHRTPAPPVQQNSPAKDGRDMNSRSQVSADLRIRMTITPGRAGTLLENRKGNRNVSAWRLTKWHSATVVSAESPPARAFQSCRRRR